MAQNLKRDRRVLTVLAECFDVFDCKGRVAKLKNVELEIHVKPGAEIPKTSPIFYDRERTEHIERDLKEWLDKGYIERGKVRCAFPPVVVKKKGPKKFRTCVNFQPLNEIILLDPELEAFKGDDVEIIVSQGGEAAYICVVDCKEAHNAV